MRFFALMAVLVSSSAALASGSFECQDPSTNTRIAGSTSSAGTFVREVKIKGKVLKMKEGFTADALYVGQSSFSFKIMDGDRDKILFQVETVKRNTFAAGLAWEPMETDENTRPIICEFLE